MGWDGKYYPNPPPDGWHQASDGRWWAPGTGPKGSLPEPTAADSSQPIPPGNDVAIPAISRDPERAGTWPTSGDSAAKEPVSEGDAVRSQIPADRRMTREEFEAARTQREANQTPAADSADDGANPANGKPQRAELAPRDQPPAETNEENPSNPLETILPGQRTPAMYDPDQSERSSQPESVDPTAQMNSQTTILPNNMKADSASKASSQPSPKQPPPSTPVPQPASLENSTNAKGEPFVPAPPNPNARPLPIDEDEKSLLVPIVGSALALLLLAGAIFWFFVLRTTDDADTATSESSITTTTAVATTDEQSTVAPTTTASTTSTATTTTTAPTSSDTTSTIESEEVTPTSATIPKAQVVSKFRESLASNGLNSSVLTDDDIVKFGEDFCFVASNSKDRSEYDTEAQAAIDDSASQLSDEELRLIIDTAVVVSCPDQAERLNVSV